LEFDEGALLDEKKLFAIISEQLQEVDEELAIKKKSLAKDDPDTVAQKLQHSVRDWLKETRL
jgi:hypothetical protein